MPDLRTIRTSAVAPEVFPGGVSWDTVRKRLSDLAGDINYNFEQLNLSLTITGSLALDGTNFVIARAGTRHPFWTHRALAKTVDGQYVFVYQNVLPAGGTQRTTVLAKKAVSPFDTWTDLSGDSSTSTQIATSTSANQIVDSPPFVQEASTQSLFVVTIDNSGATPKLICVQVTYDGDGTFTVGSSATITDPGAATMFNMGDIISPVEGVLLCIAQNGPATPPSDIAAIYKSDTTNTWSNVAEFATGGAGAYFQSGNQKRLIALDGDRILALMECFTVGTLGNVAWALSTDGGDTWPASLGAANTGLMLTSNNLEGSGLGGVANGHQWDAALIPGTSKVGVVYHANTSGGGTAGVKYAVFDADTPGFNAEADHISLNTVIVEKSPVICLSDGTARVLWLHTQDKGSNKAAYAVGYRKCATALTQATDLDNWRGTKEILHFGSMLGTTDLLHEQLTLLQGGLDTVGGISVLPMIFSRYDATNALETDICFKLLPVSGLDS